MSSITGMKGRLLERRSAQGRIRAPSGRGPRGLTRRVVAALAARRGAPA